MDFPELITIGSNTLDIIIDIDDILRFELFDKEIIKKYTAIEYSRKLNVKNVRFIPGGSGANIAANCSMLGLKSAYIGVMGNDFSAEICLTDMKKRGVDLSQVIQTDNDTTALSIILKTPWGKDRSILAYKGANNLLKPSDVNNELFNNIKAFSWTSLTTDNGCKAIEKAITLTKDKGGGHRADSNASRTAERGHGSSHQCHGLWRRGGRNFAGPGPPDARCWS